jgi:hypothetical protein
VTAAVDEERARGAVRLRDLASHSDALQDEFRRRATAEAAADAAGALAVREREADQLRAELAQAREQGAQKVSLAVEECKRRHRAMLQQLAEQEKLERAQWQTGIVEKLRREAEAQIAAAKDELRARRDQELEVSR